MGPSKFQNKTSEGSVTEYLCEVKLKDEYCDFDPEKIQELPNNHKCDLVVSIYQLKPFFAFFHLFSAHNISIGFMYDDQTESFILILKHQEENLNVALFSNGIKPSDSNELELAKKPIRKKKAARHYSASKKLKS